MFVVIAEAYKKSLSFSDADIVQDLPAQLSLEEEERSLKRKT